MSGTVHRWAVVCAGRSIERHTWVLADVLGVYPTEGCARDAAERYHAAGLRNEVVYVAVNPAWRYVLEVPRD